MEWREATDEETGCFLAVGEIEVGESMQLLPVDAGVPLTYPEGLTLTGLPPTKFCFGKEYVFYFGEELFAGKVDHNMVMIRR